MKMEIEPIPVTTKDKIVAGNIVELQVDSKGNKTEKPIYYLIGYSEESDCYYLVNIETGEMVMVGAPEITYLSKETLTSMIEHYDGKVYNGDKAKLVVEDIKTNEIWSYK